MSPHRTHAHPAPSPLRVAFREVDALRRQTPLLVKNVGARLPEPTKLRPGEDVVFFLHGVMATAGVFDPIERRLHQVGVKHVASFSYHPLRTVASLAEQLRDTLAPVPRSCRVHLVGHSLGGIAIRYFVQELSGDWVTQTISLASPFHGTAVARWLPVALARELRPASPLLSRLLDPARRTSVPHTSVGASGDVVVSPVSRAMFPGHDAIVVDGVGHNGLLFDDHVAEVVVRRITRQ